MTAQPQSQERLCSLAALAGRTEICKPDECPLWENGACQLEPMLEPSAADPDDEDAA
ncbi:MAG TPA: hypothetical protein VH968_13340 [Gaiellaceae bacterium]|jgi:hypothetical protein